jgi:membrane-associated phospholipid phosphatase
LLLISPFKTLRKIIFILFSIISVEANAQILDTVKKDLFTAPDTVKHLHSNASALIVPAALITYGALSFEIHPIRRFDYYINSTTSRTDRNFHTKAESYFLFAPLVMTYGLNMVGVQGKNTFIDRTALLGLSTAFMGISTFPLKRATHRLRPDGSDKLSFPSGHTAAAFTFAEFLAQEYSDKSPIYTIVGYGFATATGVFRMYNKAHWFSDVVAGAGFGILSTKAAYLVYPYLRNALTHTDKAGKSTFIMPTYQDGVAGLSFSKAF